MEDRINWSFEDYLQKLKWHIALYKTAAPGTGYLKDIINELNDEIWQFFPQDCTDLRGAWSPWSGYLDFFDE